ncbi:ABC transporter ATP-binding protein [Actinomadura hibisca]|uniref:ABC transporter ATP-binding protein n=1 Tax=Actinomadura hibisca TaxID=68565 RepID=UPI00082EEA32|nr:ABC transporter ATP-binding protein [Actinomadura hibisca]
MNGNVIEVTGLTVRCGGTEVLREVSFAVAAGRVYAVLGRHGSGKTTLLEAVAGLRRPMSGRVRVRGADPYESARDAPVAAVWSDGGLFPGLTPREIVDTWRRWTCDPLDRDEALRLVGLTGAADVPFERLTAGQRRRLDLALALVGRSDVLLLDEPTSGLDEADRCAIWTVLRTLAAAGTTVLLATRDAAEAACADQVGVLDEARLPVRRATGSMAA